MRGSKFGDSAARDLLLIMRSAPDITSTYPAALPAVPLVNFLCAASRERVVFSLAAGATFLALGLGCYALYGRRFLDEAFL